MASFPLIIPGLEIAMSRAFATHGIVPERPRQGPPLSSEIIAARIELRLCQLRTLAAATSVAFETARRASHRY